MVVPSEHSKELDVMISMPLCSIKHTDLTEQHVTVNNFGVLSATGNFLICRFQERLCSVEDLLVF